jgi:hypothetical protein
VKVPKPIGYDVSSPEADRGEQIYVCQLPMYCGGADTYTTTSRGTYPKGCGPTPITYACATEGQRPVGTQTCCAGLDKKSVQVGSSPDGSGVYAYTCINPSRTCVSTLTGVICTAAGGTQDCSGGGQSTSGNVASCYCKCP